MSNMSLSQALKEHKERRRKDSNAVMTMVIKQSKPSPITRQSRLGTEELFMVIDPETKQLLYYEDRADNLKGYLSLDKALLTDNTSISFQNDKQVCFVALVIILVRVTATATSLSDVLDKVCCMIWF